MTAHVPCEPLTEQVADWHSEQLRVDFESRLVTNVVLSGGVSRNGYRYAEDALRAAAALYDRKPVFLDHAPQPTRPLERSTRDLVGWVLNARFEDGRIRGDIQALDTEAGRTFLALIDADSPAVGMSHVVLGQRGRDPQVIERIHEVVSVDAVVFPATTSSFREADNNAAAAYEALVEQVQAATLELEALRQQWHAACTERNQLREQLNRRRDQQERQRRIEHELTAAGVPEFVITPAFREQLEQTPDADGRRRLLAERLDLARRCRPHQPASQPRATSATSSDEAFLRAVRRSGFGVRRR